MGTEGWLVQTQCLTEDGRRGQGRRRKKKHEEKEGQDRAFFIVYSKSRSTALRACEHAVDICINMNWDTNDSIQTAEAPFAFLFLILKKRSRVLTGGWGNRRFSADGSDPSIKI